MPRRTLKLLKGFLAPYPWVLPLVTLLGTAASLAEGFGIGLLIPFLALLMEGAMPQGSALAEAAETYAQYFDPDIRLIAVSVTIVLLVTSRCLLNFVYLALLTSAGARVAHDLRSQLFAHFLEADFHTIARETQGRQINVLQGSCQRVGHALMDALLMAVNACTALVFVVLMLLISWQMALLTLAGVLIAGLATRTLAQRSSRVGESLESGSAALDESAVQVLNVLRMIRIFGQEAREHALFNHASKRVRKAQFKLEFAWRAMQPLVDLLYVPLLLGTLLIAWYADIGLAVLMPFLFLVFRLQRYMRDFDIFRVRVASYAPAVEDVAGLLREARDGPRVADGTRPFTGLRERITFDRVSFCYDHQSVEMPRKALDEVSLEIHRGETVALVGGSGAGKSTLVNLLCRLAEPNSGEIRVDDIPLGEFQLSSWRRGIGFAGQDADLRPGTIAENIAYGDPDATPERISEAATQTHIHALIEALPSGYETPVGTRGTQFSGGERQRIALARALLRHPNILILDEATNAVDNMNELAIRRTLEALAGEVTTIIIAHRLSSTRLADRIIVMHEGKVVEMGGRAELLERRGAFSRLLEVEAG